MAHLGGQCLALLFAQVLELDADVARPARAGAPAAGDVALAAHIMHQLLAAHARVRAVKAVAAQHAPVAAWQHLVAGHAAAAIRGARLKVGGRAQGGRCASFVLLAHGRHACEHAARRAQHGQHLAPVLAGGGPAGVQQCGGVAKDDEAVSGARHHDVDTLRLSQKPHVAGGIAAHQTDHHYIRFLALCSHSRVQAAAGRAGAQCGRFLLLVVCVHDPV